MAVFLVRHGETPYNKGANGPDEERVRGWNDVPLTKDGLKEASTVANKLKDKNIGTVVSSDLRRAKQTANVLHKELKVPNKLVFSKSFRPWHLGDLSGEKVKAVGPILKHLSENPDVKAPNGESLNDFLGRFLPGLSQVVSHSQATGQNVAVVAHLRNLLAVKAYFRHGGNLSKIAKPGSILYDKQTKTGSILKLDKGKLSSV